MRCGNNQDEIKWIMRIHNETMQNHEKLGIKGRHLAPLKVDTLPSVRMSGENNVQNGSGFD